MIYGLLLFANFWFYLSDYCLFSSGNTAWLSIILTSLVVSLILFVINHFLKKSKSTFDFNRSKIFNITLYFFTITKLSIYMSQAARGINLYFMPNSPENFIVLLFLAGFLICLFSRKNTLLTIGGLMGAVILGIGIFISITSAKSFDFNRVFPIISDRGIKSLISLPYIFNIANLLYFYRDNQRRVPFKPLIISAVLGSVLLLSITLIRPYELLNQSKIMGVYSLSSLASIGIIFQRSEVLLLIAWAFSVLASCGFLIYEASHTFKCAFDLKDARGLSGIHLIIVYALSDIFLKFDLTKIYKAVAVMFFIYAVLCGIAYITLKAVNFKGVDKNAV